MYPSRSELKRGRELAPLRWLEGLAPYDPSPERYRHNRTGEDNGDAHHKRQVMGREVVVAVTEGKLDFGPWERIFYGEFDGNRPKRALTDTLMLQDAVQKAVDLTNEKGKNDMNG